MLEFVRRKSGTAAPGWAFDLKRDRAVPEEVARSGWLRNFAPRGRNRKRRPTPRGVSRECSRCFLQILRKKKSRALLDPVKTLMRASRDSRLPGPVGNRRRKPPRCKKRMHLWRSQTDRKIANLHGFNPSFHPVSQLCFVWPKPFVPVSQNRKNRQHELRSRPRRLI